MILPLIIFSIIISFSRNNIFLNWFILEFNLFLFICLLILPTKNSINNLKASVIYFIVQSFSSSILLFFILINSIFFISNKNINILFRFISILTLLIKINSFPFHLWSLIISSILTWPFFLILHTIQKLNPLIIIYNFIDIKYQQIIFIFFSLLNIIIGSIFILNKSSIITILFFSSIHHLGWIIILLTLNFLILIIYIITYFLTFLFIILLLNYYKIFNLNQTSTLKLINKYLFLILILSYRGGPPIRGFFIKIRLINLFNQTINRIHLITLLIILPAINFYIYLLITFNCFTNKVPQKKLFNLNKYSNNIPYYIYSLILTILNPYLYYIL